MKIDLNIDIKYSVHDNLLWSIDNGYNYIVVGGA